MERLSFNNRSMSLFVKSAGRFFAATHISDETGLEENIKMSKNGYVCISGLPNSLRTSIYAEQYSSVCSSSKVSDLSTEEKKFSNLYIKDRGNYFQVFDVQRDEKTVNDIMKEHEDVALIATDNAGRHYLASIDPVASKA